MPNESETDRNHERLLDSDGHDLAAEEKSVSGPSRFLLFNAMPSWLVSFLLHVALILLLALVFLPDNTVPPISFEVSNVSGDQLESLDVNLDSTDPESSSAPESVQTPEMNLSQMPIPEVIPESLPVESLSDISSAFQASQPSAGSGGGGEFSGRSAEGRASALNRGATVESEQAVDLALQWLAKHQLPNGSFNFDHSLASPESSKLNPGVPRYSNCVNAATAFGLLPFLGAGHTHVNGDYKDVVGDGLEFLKRNAEPRNTGYSWWEPEGTMYSHGLVAIAFCEAYAMTGDISLHEYAQGGIQFIEYAQNERWGGWKYSVGQAGDTSVTGWQVMALKSAKMGGLATSDETWKLANKFLESVSTEDGAYYHYDTTADSKLPQHNKSRVAVGLLCRMYMGWERERPGLINGVTWLSKKKPSTGTTENPNGANMYFNYYATQVLKHFGGEMWKEWNEEMRDYLVSQQSTKGAERGSWYFDRSDDEGPEAGGRLYCTAMSAMTLEVYYRFLPLYDNKSVLDDDDFPLD